MMISCEDRILYLNYAKRLGKEQHKRCDWIDMVMKDNALSQQFPIIMKNAKQIPSEMQDIDEEKYTVDLHRT